MMCMNYIFCTNVTQNWVNDNLVDLENLSKKPPLLGCPLVLSIHKQLEGMGRKDLAGTDDLDKSPPHNAKASRWGVFATMVGEKTTD